MVRLLMEIGTALLIAGGFAGIGRLLLSPKSPGIFSLNNSFLIGAGISAAALFPLSAAFPHTALWIIWVGILSGAFLLVVTTLRRWASRNVTPEPKSITRRFGPIGSLGWVLLVLIVLSSLGFTVLNGHWRLGYDGLMIWATKAQVLFVQGELSPEPVILFEKGYLERNATYPPLIPLYEALMSMTHRQFHFDRSKTVFLLFYVSLLLSTYRTARTLTNVRLGLVATAIVSWLPAVSSSVESYGGYADLPLACFLMATTATLLDEGTKSGWRSAAPWLMGSLLMVKDEGIILLTIACFLIFVTWLSRPLSGVLRRINENKGAIAVIVLMLLLRLGYLRWLGYHDNTYRPVNFENLKLAATLVGEVARICGPYFLNFQKYGILWPTFVLFGGLLLAKGSTKERALTTGAILAILAYTSPFLFTGWVIALQVSTAYDRLLTQLVPVAAVCIVAGYHAARSALNPPGTTG